MKAQTRFDLNLALENWRAELAAQVHLTPDDRRELETHLRDSFAGLQAGNLSDEEAFWLARRRVGQPQQLAEEFVKSDPTKVWRERVFWMAFGTIFFWQAFLISSYTEGIVLSHWNPQLISTHQKYWQIFAGLPIFVIIYALVENQNHAVQKSKWIFQNRFRLVMIMVILAALCTLTQMELGRQESFPNGYPLTVTWADWFKTFFLRLWSYLLFSLVPLIFIVWFLPTQNHQTPKRA